MPMKDLSLKAMLSGSHGWQSDGDTWVYGVAIPRNGVNPNEIADYMTSLGVIVLPAMHDPDDPDPDPAVIAALGKHGVVKGDKTRHIAKKLYAASGHSGLRPHFF